MTLDLSSSSTSRRRGRLVSIPADRRPAVNDLFLRRGRWIERGRPDEVLASEGFVDGARPGARRRSVPAVINGRLRRLDHRRRGALAGVRLQHPPRRAGAGRPAIRRCSGWSEQALAAAFDMEGGFNDVALTLGAGASAEDAIAQLDRLLEPYGGLGAIPRALQLSHWMLENELAQLQSFGFLLPLIFLIVAAFILNVALTRALALQRAADRRAQGARVRQHGARLALHEVGAR